jgi:hypothetical protein
MSNRLFEEDIVFVFIFVGEATLKSAAALIHSCEHCHPDDAEIPFDWLLAEVTGRPGPYEFVLAETARCPICKHEITEKTLIDPR